MLIKKSGHWVHFLEATSSDWQIGRYATATASQLNTALNRQNLLLATAVNHSIARYYPEMSNRGLKSKMFGSSMGLKTLSLSRDRIYQQPPRGEADVRGGGKLRWLALLLKDSLITLAVIEFWSPSTANLVFSLFSSLEGPCRYGGSLVACSLGGMHLTPLGCTSGVL